MGIYSKHVFPRMLDWALGTPAAADQRRAALAPAFGRVLEIGFGTGLNLPFYPDAVGELTALDSEDLRPDLVARRISQSGRKVNQVIVDAGMGLEFEDGDFDTVVTTWTLCSIDDVTSALKEIRRVLCPGGQYLFCEHGRSPRLGVWQDRFNPVQRVIGCGCNLNRQIDDLIRDAGFHFGSLETYIAPETPELFGYMYRGVAKR